MRHTRITLPKLYQVLMSSLLVITSIKADCDNPPSIPNASSNITGTKPFQSGTIIRYECEPGYNPAGTSRMFTCNSTDWIGANFRCEEIYCSHVQTPENGKVENSPTNEAGTSINFACNEGHEMTGSNTMLCRTDGKWKPPTPPVCTAKDCGEFESIQHADTFQDNSAVGRNLYGSVVTVTCQDDYVLDGSPRVRCGANGQWGDRPTCKPSSCPPYPITNSSCIANAVLSKSFYFILCKQDVSVTKTGPENAECIDSEWDTLDMSCFCDCYIAHDAGIVVIGNLNTKGYLRHNATLQWSCIGGSSKSSVDYIVCKDGTLNAVVDGEKLTNVNSTIESELCVLATTTVTSTTETVETSTEMVTESGLTDNSTESSIVSTSIHTRSKSNVTIKTTTVKKFTNLATVLHASVHAICLFCCLHWL